MRAARIGLSGAAALGALLLGLLVGFDRLGGIPAGVRVGGVPLAREDAAGQLARRAEAWAEEPLRIEVDGSFRTRARGELGARVDVEAALAGARSVAHRGEPVADARDLLAAWSGEVDLPWRVAVDSGPVRALVRELAHEVDRPARGPRFSAAGRLVELSEDGARLDRAGAVAAIVGALRRGERAVRLPATTLSSGVGDQAAPPVARPPARPVVLARYATDYHPRERDRSHNLATAAGYLDGATIPARGRLSFNDRVGARSRARGYRDAHVIVGGEMVDGIGGGVCQIASTLHAAAFLGGFDFVEHHPHSRPSAYIPMGLDATVVWPNVDLVIANPYPFEVTVRARADRGQVVVELLGVGPRRAVDWRRRTLDTEPWTERFVEDPSIAEGDEVVSQRPILGYTILRERTIEDARGVHLEERRIVYPPTDRIVRVAPGYANAVPDNPY